MAERRKVKIEELPAEPLEGGCKTTPTFPKDKEGKDLKEGQRVRNPAKGLTGILKSVDPDPGQIITRPVTCTVLWDGDTMPTSLVNPEELEIIG